MPHATAFAIFAALFTALAVRHGGLAWALLWPAASFVVVAAAYAGAGPRLFGKRADGRMAAWAIVLLAPFLLLTWGVWYLLRLFSRGGAGPGHEVAPGVWVGRRAGARELPPGTRLVVDLTSEFWAPRGVGGTDACAATADRRYLCLPTLDGTAPHDDTVRATVEAAAAAAGPVYIHCAQGRGRSAALAAAILIARGVARDPAEAEALLRKARPEVRLNRAQRAWVRRVTADLPVNGAAAAGRPVSSRGAATEP